MPKYHDVSIKSLNMRLLKLEQCWASLWVAYSTFTYYFCVLQLFEYIQCYSSYSIQNSNDKFKRLNSSVKDIYDFVDGRTDFDFTFLVRLRDYIAHGEAAEGFFSGSFFYDEKDLCRVLSLFGIGSIVCSNIKHASEVFDNYEKIFDDCRKDVNSALSGIVSIDVSIGSSLKPLYAKYPGNFVNSCVVDYIGNQYIVK